MIYQVGKRARKLLTLNLKTFKVLVYDINGTKKELKQKITETTKDLLKMESSNYLHRR